MCCQILPREMDSDRGALAMMQSQQYSKAIRYKAKYVLDAELAKCFYRIDPQALLAKVTAFPSLRRQIIAWIKSGVRDAGMFQETSKGTPQGGVISTLLANIALPRRKGQIIRRNLEREQGHQQKRPQLNPIRRRFRNPARKLRSSA